MTTETLSALPSAQNQEGDTSDMPVSEKPRKKYKPRERDPIKLIMERGIRTKEVRETFIDEEGEEQEAVYVQQLLPQGAVLTGEQVGLVAMTLVQYQRQVQILQGIVQEYQNMLNEEDGKSGAIGATDLVDTEEE